MTLDLKITGGTIVDGSGSEPFTGDVGVKDGRIVEVGNVGAAEKTIDAKGAIVTPGFTDVHCHYDGQVSWDPELSPSSLHGVTTCVLGNCGVGFAPVKPTDHKRLIELMEGVEDIPGSALAEGLTWNWESFPEYMSAIDAFPHAIDFATQVTHDALRVYVMGDRGANMDVATDDDIQKMAELVRESIEAGAAGFSTGRTDNHLSVDGKPTPASEASARELVGLAAALKGLNHGVLQAVSDFDMNKDPARFDAEFDLIEEMAKASGGHRTSVSLMQRDQAPMQWKDIMRRAEAASKKGYPIHLQVGARPIGVLLGFEATFHPFMGFPSYKKISHLPLAERIAEMRNPEFRKQILSEKTDKVAGDGSPIPPLADQLLDKIDVLSMRLFRLGENPDYEPKMEDSLYASAYAKGIAPLQEIYDTLLENDGKELIYFPIYNFTEFSLDNVHTMLTHELAIPGLSDGGAHVGTVCDASFPTFMLTHWTRDRKDGKLPIQRVVQMMAHDTSRHIGLSDRGLVKVGMKADLNVIDMDRLRLHRPTMLKDLPAGGQRLLQRASGYIATIVSGTPIIERDERTGALPGGLVRVGKA